MALRLKNQASSSESDGSDSSDASPPPKLTASTISDAGPPTLSMKLLVDTKSQRVLYAEAGKDVVDFILSLLTLPVGRVVKILGKDNMVGCIGELHSSVQKLDIPCGRAKNKLLSPPGGGNLLRPPLPEPAEEKQLYRCFDTRYEECRNCVTQVYGQPCQGKGCPGLMTRAKDGRG